ncbi:hypothetical protein [Phyllobacterium sp. K27]
MKLRQPSVQLRHHNLDFYIGVAVASKTPLRSLGVGQHEQTIGDAAGKPASSQTLECGRDNYPTLVDAKSAVPAHAFEPSSRFGRSARFIPWGIAHPWLSYLSIKRDNVIHSASVER